MAGNVSGITGNSNSNKPIIEIKTSDGTFKIDESLFKSFDNVNRSVTLVNDSTITMGKQHPNGKVTVKNEDNIQILSEGASVHIDTKDGIADDLYVEAKESIVVISADEQDKISARTPDGNGDITFGPKSVFEESQIDHDQRRKNAALPPNILMQIDFYDSIKEALASSEEHNVQTNNEREDQTEANEIKKYDELVKNLENKNWCEEEYNEIYWLATKYGFIAPDVAIHEKDEAAVENYNALMHKYYETKKLNLDETVEVNLISRKYNTLLPLELKTIVPDDSIRSLGFTKFSSK